MYCTATAVIFEIRKQQSMTALLSEHETRFITIMTEYFSFVQPLHGGEQCTVDGVLGPRYQPVSGASCVGGFCSQPLYNGAGRWDWRITLVFCILFSLICWSEYILSIWIWFMHFVLHNSEWYGRKGGDRCWFCFSYCWLTHKRPNRTSRHIWK